MREEKVVLDNNNNDPNFERKLDLVLEGARPFLKKHLIERSPQENSATIVAYILAMQV